MVKRKTVRKVFKKSRRKSIKRISRKSRRGGKNSKKGIRTFKKKHSKKIKRTKRRKLNVQIRNNYIHVNKTVRIGKFKLRPGNKLNFLPQGRKNQEGGAKTNEEMLWGMLFGVLEKNDVFEYKKSDTEPYKYYCITGKQHDHTLRLSSYKIDKKKDLLIINGSDNLTNWGANAGTNFREKLPKNVTKACNASLALSQLSPDELVALEEHMEKRNTQNLKKKLARPAYANINIAINSNLAAVDSNLDTWKPKTFGKKDLRMSVEDCSSTSSEILGRGGGGVVFKAKINIKNENGTNELRDVAVKQISFPTDTKKALGLKIKEFQKEVNMMLMLEHPNIVRILGYCTSPQLKVAMELIDGGDLYNVLHEKGAFEPQELLQYAYDIAMGMEYLHSFTPPVLHRDLKSPNILVSKKKVNGINQNILKISDFGLARVAATNMDSEKMTQAGTPYWSAPELLRDEVYNEKVDVYSCAIVFYEIYGQRSPYEHMATMEVSVQVTTPDEITGAYLRPDMSVIDFKSENVKSLIIKMWDNDPTKRPTFTEVCNELEGVAKDLNFTLRTSRPAQAQAQAPQVHPPVQDDV